MLSPLVSQDLEAPTSRGFDRGFYKFTKRFWELKVSLVLGIVRGGRLFNKKEVLFFGP